MDWVQVFTGSSCLFREHKIEFAFHVGPIINGDEFIPEKHLYFLLMVAALRLVFGTLRT